MAGSKYQTFLKKCPVKDIPSPVEYGGTTIFHLYLFDLMYLNGSSYLRGEKVSHIAAVVMEKNPTRECIFVIVTWKEVCCV